jgi:RimJ/RimL family protein N-acetyltransferase
MTEQPLGQAVDGRAARFPERVVLEGQYVDVVPLATSQSDELYEAVGQPGHADLWTYLLEGPFTDREAFDAALARWIHSPDPLFYAIRDTRTGRAVGRAALMRIEPLHRVIEVGSITYSAALQRTRGATEAMFLLARYVFEDLGYRRYEWKCNALNAPSRAAAVRLGFTFEGVFRAHMIAKGRNRDTAWYSMLDTEWPAQKRRIERWLAPENFDENGRQRTSLSAIRQA